MLQDSLYYYDVDGSEEKSSIVVKQLVLALPENRLATLLSQHKFEEAEEFARKFALDPKVLVCYKYGLDMGLCLYCFYRTYGSPTSAR